MSRPLLSSACRMTGSLMVSPGRARHRNSLPFELRLRPVAEVTVRSAQYPSGNHTYSYPALGGRGGSTPNGPASELSFLTKTRRDGDDGAAEPADRPWPKYPSARTGFGVLEPSPSQLGAGVAG